MLKKCFGGPLVGEGGTPSPLPILLGALGASILALSALVTRRLGRLGPLVIAYIHTPIY